MSDDDIKMKFRMWASKALAGSKIESAANMVFNLGKVQNISELTALLSP